MFGPASKVTRRGKTAGGGDDVNIRAAFVFCGESDLRAVGRKARIGFRAGAGGEAGGFAAFAIHCPDFAGVDEGDLGFVHGGLAEQEGFFGLGLGESGEEKQGRSGGQGKFFQKRISFETAKINGGLL